MSKETDDQVMHVIDANVFIHGASHQLPPEFTNPVTVPEVIEELRSRAAGTRFEVEDVPVYEPGEETVSRVQEAADNVGEDLSDTDVNVVALALEQGGVVVSDDYGVQNVAALLDVDYKGFLKDEITEQIKWQYRCRSCGHTVTDATGEACPVCGGTLKKVAREKHDL